MPVLYRDIISEIAVRVDAVVGASKMQKTAALAVDLYTDAQIGSVDFTLTTIQKAAVAAVARIVRTYAFIKNHPFRLNNLTQTAFLAHKSLIPATNAAGKSIVGVYGQIRDVSDNEPLTEQPKQIIETVTRSKTSGDLKKNYYYYAIEDGRIYHTRTNVVIDVVSFDAAAEKAAAVAGAASPLPDDLFDVAWNAALAVLWADDAYTQTATIAENYTQNALGEMKNGATAFSPAPEFALPSNAQS